MEAQVNSISPYLPQELISPTLQPPPPPPRTIFHGCHSVHWDPPDAKKICPQKNIGLGYVKMHGFHGNPLCTS